MLEEVTKNLRNGDVRTIVAVSAGVLALLYVVTRKKQYKLPPGPWGLPLLGNVTSFMGKGNISDVLNKIGEKYGPVFSLKLVTWKVVVLNKFDVAREALVQKQDDFAGRPQSASMDLAEKVFGAPDLSMADIGPLWKLHRKIASSAVRKYSADKNLERLIHHCCNITISAIQKEAEKGLVAVDNYLYHLTLNILYGMCFGKHYEADDPFVLKMKALSEEMTTLFGSGLAEDYLPIAKYFPSKQRREIVRLIKKYKGMVSAAYNESKDGFNQDKGNIKDFTGYLLQAREEVLEKGHEYDDMLSDNHLIMALLNVFGAGIDTTRHTLNWLIVHMAQHVDIQEKMQEEIDSVLGNTNLPTLEMKSHLQYTEAVIYESIRCASFAPTGLPHTTMCDTTVGGYDVPKGTMIMVNFAGINHDPDLWEEPDSFRPERFIDENGKTYRPEGYIPFSMGRRVCLGETFAKTELMVIVPMLFRMLKFTPPKGEKFTVEEEYTLMNHIAKSYNVDVEVRKK